MPLGGAVTCTITNTDNTPTLKLVKIGHEQRRWHRRPRRTSRCRRCRPVRTRRGTSRRRRPRPSFHNIFGATVYNLSESGPAGYTASAWSCDGGTQSGASISVPLGGAVTCTIIEQRQHADVEVGQVVTNNDGGTATAADFTLSAVSAGADARGTSPRRRRRLSFHNVFGATVYNLVGVGPGRLHGRARGAATVAPSPVRRSRCRSVAQLRARSPTRTTRRR